MIDKDMLRAMYAHAKYSNSKSGIRNMIELSKSNLAIGQEDLDSNPWLFNVQNGTIDLRTGQLREQRREDFITKLSLVTFDPDATCPRWKSFLRVIINDDEELIAYLQRLVGYCLAGVTEEHILPFLYGTGANGKSTFVETVLKLFGPDYAMKAPYDLLMAKSGQTHPTERADLFGKRFVACIETEEGRRMAEALVKELTGGDRVRARRMREDFWEFVPTHHIWLVSNHKPVITGTDHGIWRRIKLIPFNVVIPDAEQDKKLPAKLAAELPGILNWAIAGCLDWQQNGMREPEIVQAATSEYSSEMDEVGQFIDQYCELGNFIESARALFEAFQKAMPDSSITQRSFGDRLREKGFLNRNPETGREYRTNKGKHAWKGLKLRSLAQVFLD
jgi:putative DNA primase/helicase